MRTLVDIPENKIDDLDSFCHEKSISRAEGVRRAIDHYLQYVERPGQLEQYFGLWSKKSNALKGGVEYQRKLRKEWL